ncbi:MAG: K(+)/H(+) antiporter [Vezdaea aestivalis]|nr:MAG: K(+)/H(+) antiporter [Vezdaea aestivalis]
MDLFPRAGQRAASQGGILEGANPSHYNPKDPITLFIIQAGIIIIFCRLLHFPLSKIRQPRVIAEVIGGIILGPSVMGRIPGFKAAIFPDASLPNLSNVANLGLILFLFLVGVEVDMRLFLKNFKVAASVGAAGMILPFGLGCAIAYGLYEQFKSEPGTVHVSLGVYMLFIGVAMAITAFPVLCRILTEFDLLSTDVGLIVLAAGIANDVTGWVLLALTVALVNAGTGLTALWVLLTGIAWVVFLVYAIRPAFLWVLHKSGSLQNGPSQSIVTLTLLLVLASSFFTGVIGVHPIFGAFLIGLICPHDGGFAIKLTEKLEDIIGALFLPLYFALSGLSTNIGLLDDGITWAYVIGVLACAFFGKLIGGTIAARLCKLVWRESFTIGVLMSCKGLVELIVLNIGLQAKILSVRVFTIFVVMALVTTFATSPLTQTIYPPAYRRKLELWRAGEIDWDGNRLAPSDDSSVGDGSYREKRRSGDIRKLLVYLRLDSLPGLFTFMTLLSEKDGDQTVTKVHPKQEQDDTTAADPSIPQKKPLEVHGLRLVELTERTSSVMQVSEVDELAQRDPLVNVLHTFGQMNNVAVSGSVAVVPESSYGEAMTNKALDLSTDMILVPWIEASEGSELARTVTNEHRDPVFTTGMHSAFMQEILANRSCTAAIFVNRGFGAASHRQPREGGPGLRRNISAFSLTSARDKAVFAPIADRSHHIFFPYFGGADDRAALRFVLQLARNSNVTATILHASPTPSAKNAVTETTSSAAAEITELPATQPSGLNKLLHRVHQSRAEPTTTSPSKVPSASETAPNSDRAFFTTLRDSLPLALKPRVLFTDAPPGNSDAITTALELANAEVGQSPKNAGDLIVVGRVHEPHILAAQGGVLSPVREDYGTALYSSAGWDMKKSLGGVAERVVRGNTRVSVLVMQAGGGTGEDFS